jgi:hypothetical protein
VTGSHFLLEQDKRIPGIAGIGEGPPGLDPTEWLAGHALSMPAGTVELTLQGASGTEMTDIIGGLFTVVSDALRSTLEQAGISNIGYAPARLRHPVTDESTEGYWLINIIGRIACVDLARSTIVPRPGGGKGILESFEIDTARTQGARLFRLHEKPTLIVIDGALRQQLLEAPLDGVRLRATSAYDGF